jgi:DNA-binding XRE family transcriptional regulator
VEHEKGFWKMNHLSVEEYAAKRGITAEDIDRESRRLSERLGVWKLKEVRKSHGITQKELAASMQVSQKRISDLENGNLERVRVDTLQRYASGLKGSLRVVITLPEGAVVDLV